jgi:hypothetical protein
MNLRTHLSRSNGYRELGMYDESKLILEDMPLGDMKEAKDLVRRVFKLNGSSPDPSASLGEGQGLGDCQVSKSLTCMGLISALSKLLWQ